MQTESILGTAALEVDKLFANASESQSIKERRSRAALRKKIESASGARKKQGALGDERRSSNLRKWPIKMLDTLEFWPSANARIEQKSTMQSVFWLKVQ